jgi:NAD(P)-dependent dehydrogenase (short-subunit alcohol dehydrogenase family)
VKLLEGKRFKSDASAGDQPCFLLGAFPGRRVSIEFGRRTRVEVNVALLGVCDMADAVVFLASDGARFITGAGLPVDGGMGM